MLDFETRYDEARRHARDQRLEEASRRTRRETSELPSEDTLHFIRQNLEQAQIVQNRLAVGYFQGADRYIGGRLRWGVHETGLRSEENPVLKYFVSLVPRRGKARASWDKATLQVQCREKILTLDYPYIELNRDFMAALRVDCDGIFQSPEACLHELSICVRNGSIPCLPHIVVGDRLPTGQYSRPHFIWMLPQGSAVWRSTDKRCRQAPIRLFDAVARSLTSALLHLGADPAAPTMTGRMKCPTSPFWHTLTPNASHWPTLAEYAGYLGPRPALEILVRRAADIQSKMGLSASNGLFDALRTEATRLLADWHFNGDPRMCGDREALADHLHEALNNFTAKDRINDERAAYVTSKVADYLALRFDAAKLTDKATKRGRLLDVVDGLHSVKERQAAGARYAASANAEKTLQRLIDAKETLMSNGDAITKSAVAKLAGVTRGTAIRRWADLIAASAIERA